MRRSAHKVPHANANRPMRSMAARHGMSLLEVILAIAILGGALAVLGELVRVGSRSAQRACELDDSQLVCDSILAELTAGINPPTSTEGVMVDDNGQQWSYSVAVNQANQEGLLAVVVTVYRNMGTSNGTSNAAPVSFSLVRWMVDPELESEMVAAAEEAAAAAGSSSSGDSAATGESDSGSSGSGSSGSGSSGSGSSGSSGSGSSGGSTPPSTGSSPTLPPNLPPGFPSRIPQDVLDKLPPEMRDRLPPSMKGGSSR